ncbi:tRNA (adenosine(37)-N6)-threonylcarbamoyltransferase complex dimerization subunit type 1 TsaB [Actinomyces sp. B33]|uniref:tRNA (adenosine(37)-N6)-threonylcarbamoyltransferase complex dimerization subunit type 1 TsaB n=1 Tax=Actinomyces sp. B33 TaxID=2942131 RepID=UPI002342776F|nr:tRNA (adenosine(37)-N6)-threonylcarbamoyltransferase complex dimerization subunit type 1 TsaB [Actinomyces sp. B33]MDC4233618.1 tRNA (adenosine(37)-N6)-threonylcarbamoyltransferase complex dimerization subunit type 1 TsaB [Actinomyces sp. B33]
MIDLCLDTSASTAVALVADGEVLARAAHDSPRHHAESVVPLLHRALLEAGLPLEVARAGIDRVCVGTGPAPFTGLRAGLVSARVIARACGAPLHGASSLDVIARQGLDRLPPDARVFAVSDARRKELYWGCYRAEGPDDVALIGDLEVGPPQMLANQMGGSDALIVAADDLPAHCAPILSSDRTGPTAPLDPAVLARLVCARLARGDVERLGVEPLYLRRPDIHGRPAERL